MDAGRFLVPDVAIEYEAARQAPASGREDAFVDAERLRELNETGEDERREECAEGDPRPRQARAPITPSSGLLADAYDLRGIRPA
jgi:hypothetical protein